MTQSLNQAVLVFSKSYLPLNQVNVRRAIVLLVSGRAEPVEFSIERGIPVHSPSTVIWVPRYIRLTISHIHRAWRTPGVNRREILRRDKHSCQYCGSTKHLTLDHVIPRSKGGAHAWNNVVTACESCNSRKGDRTPQQAGMQLRSEPKSPVHPMMALAEQFWQEQERAFQ